MSKSLGNVIDPFAYVEQYGTDAVRYYLLSEIPAYEDGDVTPERFVRVYNSALANDLGNLMQRTLNMVEKYLDGKVDTAEPLRTLEKVDTYMNGFRFDLALREIWNEISAANRFIEEKKPWRMAKAQERDELRAVLGSLVASLRQVSDKLVPFLPGTAEKMQEILKNDILKAPSEPLCPRIET